MVKDRLLELQKAAEKRPRSNSSVIFNGTGVRLEDGFPVISDPLLEKHEWEEMDTFLANVDNIKTKLEQMNVLLRKLRDLHHKGIYSVGENVADQIADTVRDFKALSQSISAFLQGLNEEAIRLKDVHDARSRIKKDHARNLTKTFQARLKEFSAAQLDYKQQCERAISKYLKISGITMNEDEVDQKIERGELFDTVSVLLGDRDKQNLFEDVKNRHEDILKLERSIRELAEIFQDMAMLVESQGEILDRIETNVAYATDYSKRALNNVHQAQQAKKRNIALKIGAVACGIILLLIIFLLFAGVFCMYLPFICR